MVVAMYDYHARVTHVVDGDTFDADVDLGFHIHARLRFRLLGIDTPEIYGSESSARGDEARRWVESLILGKPVRIESHSTGKYGRWLARVTLEDGTDLTERLKQAGYAE